MPDEVYKLFRNSRLIGRRFRLAHVRFGREIIEVATFRGSSADTDDDEDNGSVEKNDSGRILRDNLYGSIDDDVWRRDFTCNALYYNIADYSIWDYVGGVDDIRAGLLRLIGDPGTRYREDPVRMLRAARFAARLGFRIHADSERPIADLAPLLSDVPPARLFDETLKLFLGGYAQPTFDLLQRHGLFREMFPATATCLGDESAGGFRALVDQALNNTDARIDVGKPVTPIFLFAVLLWEPIRRRAAALESDGMRSTQAIYSASDEVCREQQSYVSIPKRFTLPMRDILAMQPRFDRQQGASVLKLLAHPRFRAAYDFLLLRVVAGEVAPETADFWTGIQELDAAEQAKLAGVRNSSGRRGTRRRRRGRRRPGAREPKAN